MDLVCFSHYRWRSAAQRPRQWMQYASRRWRVVYVEEPRTSSSAAHVAIERVEGDIWVVTPHLDHGMTSEIAPDQHRRWLDIAFDTLDVQPEVLWYDIPSALECSRHLAAPVVVYDRGDGATVARTLPLREREMLARANLVFASSRTLVDRRRLPHYATHVVPGGAPPSAGTGHRRQAHLSQDPANWERSWARVESLIQDILSKSRTRGAPSVLTSEVA